MPHSNDISLPARRGWLRRRSPAGLSAARGRRRLWPALLWVVGGLVTLALVGGGALVWRLSAGPIALPWLTARIEKDISKRLSPGYSVELGETALEDSDKGPQITIAGLTLRDPQGRTLVEAPKASRD